MVSSRNAKSALHVLILLYFMLRMPLLCYMSSFLAPIFLDQIVFGVNFLDFVLLFPLTLLLLPTDLATGTNS